MKLLVTIRGCGIRMLFFEKIEFPEEIDRGDE